jgi:hypothetical protein
MAMISLRRFIPTGFWLSVLLLPAVVSAQQSERFGDYEIHYNALPTGMLNDAIAEQYGIVRSRTRGLIMLTVMRDNQAVSARIEVLARDPEDNLREIPARQVKDDNWVSYVGTFPIEAGDALIFEVDVRPHAGGGPFELAFRQSFPSGG